MKHIFPAIKTKWDQSSALKKFGGTLLFADETQSARPNTSLHGTMEPMDTFGSDIEQWNIEFRLHGRGTSSLDVMDWAESMRSVFHRATLAASAAAVLVMNMESFDGETVDDGTYDSSMKFVCYFQRNVLLPLATA